MPRNLILYLFGNSLALVGAWINYVATYWLAFHISHSASVLGILSLIIGMPLLIFSFVGGSLGDRFDRKKLYFIIQFFIAMLAIFLGALIYSYKSLEILFTFSLIFSIFFSIEAPIKQAILSNVLKEKKELAKTISWNVVINHFSRIVGPLICGLFLSDHKIYWAFVVYGIFYFLSAMCIPFLKIEIDSLKSREKPIKMFQQGINYIFGKKILFLSVITTSIVGFFLGPYTSQIPALAQEYYPNVNVSWFYIATGLGGIFSAIHLRYVKVKNNIPNIYFTGFLLAAITFPMFFFFSNKIYFGLIA